MDSSGSGSGEREVRLLLTFCKAAKHFRMERVLGSGANGMVFAVKCVHPEAPHPDKTYALKVNGGWHHLREPEYVMRAGRGGGRGGEGPDPGGRKEPSIKFNEHRHVQREALTAWPRLVGLCASGWHCLHVGAVRDG